MKRKASQPDGKASRRKAGAEEAAKRRKREATHMAGVTKRTRDLNRALSQAASRGRSDAAQVLRSLPEGGQRFVADTLAGTPTDQGVVCSGCGALIIREAGLAVHSCLKKHVLPPDVREGALVEVAVKGGEPKQQCRLCGEWAKRGDREPHACSMRSIMPVLYDSIGVTSFRDRYNSVGAAAGELLQVELRRCAELWHEAMRTRLAVSVVLLPPDQQPQSQTQGMAGGPPQTPPAATSTLTYVAPSSSIAGGCEGMRFVPGSRPETAWPRFFYHGAIVARGKGKTAGAAASAMACAFRRWQQQQRRRQQEEEGAGASAGAGRARTDTPLHNNLPSLLHTSTYTHTYIYVPPIILLLPHQLHTRRGEGPRVWTYKRAGVPRLA
ncbi:hypothetical protein HYH02_010282 [Chlamydomonas schloesseri]|uniref:Uncharacterized protein n=1 Tax=Chlamydomonas schloesseri TaxID=2026947 RepID=A0A835T802_9CHLO|nr:hypothetical protein HYH02_010282 [Chlamydomonas schloesseri]|eukprot:KAG2440393.1 hypothetical protein HYH02_010282 [Chlamydomonas schloesseri]